MRANYVGGLWFWFAFLDFAVGGGTSHLKTSFQPVVKPGWMGDLEINDAIAAKWIQWSWGLWEYNF